MADPQGHDPKLPLGTGYSRCCSCRDYFSSEASFTAHRKEGKCLTASERKQKGMAVNRKGYWVTKLAEEGAYGGAGK